jgi:glucose-6-phosphate 1-dehydrogenase
MAPDRIRLRLNLAAATGLPGVEPGCLELARPRQRLSASARMLRDVLAGDPTFMVRDDEVEASWRIVDPVLATWRTGVPPMVEYPAGSAGPVVGLAD